jgi:Mrp family chromosome partitioning ATPase
MEEFLADLEKKYDRIIFDTPPVLAVTDAVVLAGKVDGVVIVVKAGETHKNAILRAKELLESARASNILGAVLNMVEHGKTSGYYYYYRQYYGKKYGKYYGDKTGKKTAA